MKLVGKELFRPSEDPSSWSLKQHEDDLKAFLDKYHKQNEDLQFKEESVCGEDSREEIRDVHINSDILYRAICHLAVTFSGGLGASTGFFISPRKIVTAAHCIYDKKNGWGFAERAIVRPGLHRNKENLIIAPFKGEWASGFYVPEEWKENGDLEYDYGLITLATDELYRRANRPYHNLFYIPDVSIPNYNFYCLGYPDLAPFPNQSLYMSGTEKIVDISDKILSSNVDTSPGNSGGPLLFNGTNAVGICSHQYNSCELPNGFTRISAEVKEILENHPEE
ncbi:trypsin-like serine peptidase [Bacillus wiedmannii]|uniref:trypsin-like serine peptidase n=1 Tax=Bacillus wiedmannii TaxID=1890302 RepID=UPI003CF70D44